MSKTREQLEAWIKTIKIDVPSKILDVGGAQNPVKDRITRGDIFEYTILDLEEPHENSPKPDIVCDLNIENPVVDAGRPELVGKEFNSENYFDVAFCLEVAEYWWNPYQALKNINWLLKEGGKLYMSVPFVYPVHNPKHNDYLRYTDMGISRLLENAGFKVDELISRRAGSYDILMGFYDAEGMKASKDYSSHSSVGWLIRATKI